MSKYSTVNITLTDNGFVINAQEKNPRNRRHSQFSKVAVSTSAAISIITELLDAEEDVVEESVSE